MDVLTQEEIDNMMRTHKRIITRPRRVLPKKFTLTGKDLTFAPLSNRFQEGTVMTLKDCSLDEFSATLEALEDCVIEGKVKLPESIKICGLPYIVDLEFSEGSMWFGCEYNPIECWDEHHESIARIHHECESEYFADLTRRCVAVYRKLKDYA